MESYELFFLQFEDSTDPLEKQCKALELSKLFYEQPASETSEALLYLVKALLYCIENKDVEGDQRLFK